MEQSGHGSSRLSLVHAGCSLVWVMERLVVWGMRKQDLRRERCWSRSCEVEQVWAGMRVLKNQNMTDRGRVGREGAALPWCQTWPGEWEILCQP